MSNRRTLSWSVGAGSVLLLAVAAFCCTESAPSTEVPSAAPTAGGEVPQPSTTAAEPTGDARDAGITQPGVAPESVPNPVARSMDQHDVHDRALLAELERTTRRAPPKAVHELLALRRKGKTRAELEQFITDHLSDDLSVRVAVQRWLRAVSEPGADTTDDATGLAPLGQGGNPRHVQPLEPKPSEHP